MKYIFLLFFVFSNYSYATTLVRSVEVNQEDYLNYLSLNPELHTFSDDYLSINNFLKTEVVEKYDQFINEPNKNKKAQNYNELITTLEQQPLNEASRNLWLLAIQAQNSSNINPSQIESMQEKSTLFQKTESPGITLKDFDFKPQDKIFINGWQIEPTEFDKVFLNKKIDYHILILSDSYQTIHYLGKPDFLTLSRKPLIIGNCESSNFNSSKDDYIDNQIYALYPKHCVSNVKEISAHFQIENKTSANNQNSIKLPDPPKEPLTEEKYYKKPAFWGTVILSSAIAYLLVTEFSKKYELSFSF